MSLFNAYIALSGAVDADVTRNERLSHHTTYHIGGPAALFVRVHTYDALLKSIGILRREGVEWVVLGKGSNVLASDGGYDGCVIVLGREFSRISFDGDSVTAGAGAALPRLCTETLKHGLSGIEFLVGIPGTVGGAVSMDAGTRHEWVGRRIRDVVTLRPGEGLHRYAASDVEWGYRWTSIPTSEIVLETTLDLVPAPKEEISERMEALVARRRRRQPLGKPSCGSVFRNPGARSVGQLIDSCGLKGYRVGGASVSDVHANFIVNDGGATAADVIQVMSHVHDTVLERYDIDLVPEVKCLGFGS